MSVLALGLRALHPLAQAPWGAGAFLSSLRSPAVCSVLGALLSLGTQQTLVKLSGSKCRGSFGGRGRRGFCGEVEFTL